MSGSALAVQSPEPPEPPALEAADLQALPPWVRLGYSTIHGRGLYAAQVLPREHRVLEYVGQRITKAESKLREEARRAREQAGGDGCVYIFELNQRHDLDGGHPGNPARLINHACTANCETRNLRGHIWVVTRRDIAEGEELTFDYGFGIDHWRDHPCRCGTRHCLGFIVAKPLRWRVRRVLARERRQRARRARRA